MPRIYKDARHRAQKWNVGLERRKERETFCGRLRKRTPFLRWRAQLQDVRQKSQPLRRAPRNGTLDRNAGRNVKRSAKSFTVRRIWVWALQFA